MRGQTEVGWGQRAEEEVGIWNDLLAMVLQRAAEEVLERHRIPSPFPGEIQRPVLIKQLTRNIIVLALEF
jgi:hypothetical protein